MVIGFLLCLIMSIEDRSVFSYTLSVSFYPKENKVRNAKQTFVLYSPVKSSYYASPVDTFAKEILYICHTSFRISTL